MTAPLPVEHSMPEGRTKHTASAVLCIISCHGLAEHTGRGHINQLHRKQFRMCQPATCSQEVDPTFQNEAPRAPHVRLLSICTCGWQNISPQVPISSCICWKIPELKRLPREATQAEK